VSDHLIDLSERGLKGSEAKLDQAIWNKGTGQRLKRFFAKAKRGEGFTVGVVGGSGTFVRPSVQLKVILEHV
jgi:hypothetical protein